MTLKRLITKNKINWKFMLTGNKLYIYMFNDHAIQYINMINYE